MGFFTDAEIASLQIKKMSLHVVSRGSFQPEAARKVEHSDFFLERIRDTDVAPVFTFHDNSKAKPILEDLAARRKTFEKGAQELAANFAEQHNAASREGAFFVFELTAEDSETRLYSLIKYDYREVIEQRDEEAGTLLHRIVQAFVGDKQAIQKSVLVRVVDGRAQDAVAARDRVKPAPDIGDYLVRFLGVSRSLTDAELNQKAVDVLIGSLREVADLLPEGGVPRAFAHAKVTLRSRSEIDETAITEAVIDAAGSPQDEVAIARIRQVARRKFRSAKLSGLSFKPDLSILKKAPTRRLKTKEGVMITYPGEAENTFVKRTRSEDGKGEVITIHTAKITEDEVVRESAGRASR